MNINSNIDSPPLESHLLDTMNASDDASVTLLADGSSSNNVENGRSSHSSLNNNNNNNNNNSHASPSPTLPTGTKRKFDEQDESSPFPPIGTKRKFDEQDEREEDYSETPDVKKRRILSSNSNKPRRSTSSCMASKHKLANQDDYDENSYVFETPPVKKRRRTTSTKNSKKSKSKLNPDTPLHLENARLSMASVQQDKALFDSTAEKTAALLKSAKDKKNDADSAHSKATKHLQAQNQNFSKLTKEARELELKIGKHEEQARVERGNLEITRQKLTECDLSTSVVEKTGQDLVEANAQYETYKSLDVDAKKKQQNAARKHQQMRTLYCGVHPREFCEKNGVQFSYEGVKTLTQGSLYNLRSIAKQGGLLQAQSFALNNKNGAFMLRETTSAFGLAAPEDEEAERSEAEQIALLQQTLSSQPTNDSFFIMPVLSSRRRRDDNDDDASDDDVGSHEDDDDDDVDGVEV